MSASPRTLVLGGCVLVVVSWLVPVMRWNRNEAHATAGSARAFLGSSWTLADGGFPASGVAPLAAVAGAGLLAAGALVNRPWAWSITVGGAALVAAYLLWVVQVFVRKLEDVVFPAEGAAALVAGCGLIGAGVWLGRRRRAEPASRAPSVGTEGP